MAIVSNDFLLKSLGSANTSSYTATLSSGNKQDKPSHKHQCQDVLLIPAFLSDP